MKFRSSRIFGADGRFYGGSIETEGERIAGICPDEGTTGDFSGEDAAYIIPGMIDLHFHGAMGADVCDASAEAIRTIARYEASVGVTAIAPATMTLPVPELERVLACAAAYRDRQQAADRSERAFEADLVGINMEGPFISRARKGAQDEAHIIPCDTGIAERFLQAGGGLVKYIGIAPEADPDAEAFIEALKDRVRISLAHTNADYDCAMRAIRAGADHTVHLLNAMPPFASREPGVVGAVADSPAVDIEMICDGIHIHPAMVRAMFRLMGQERMILISDSMRATGLADGVYTLGGLNVKVEGRRATLANGGALAGSVTNLPDCVRTAVREMGIPIETAVACATSHAAKSLGIQNDYGVLAAGRKADFVLLDEDLSLLGVVKDGIRITG